MMHCEPGCTCCTPTSGSAVFCVTINPEARVEARRTEVALGLLQPGEWSTIPVAIVNQGFVTGRLQMRWATGAGVEVEAKDYELTGDPTQDMQFRVRLAEPRDADITVRFWALGALGGLANKNTASLYLRCGQAALE